MNRHLRALLIVAGITLLILGAAAIYKEGKRSKQAEETGEGKLSIQVNMPVPGFEATDLSSKTLQLSQFKGKVVIINFWASWCTPCVEEMPSLLKLLQSFPNDVVLLAISGDSSKDDLDSFMKSFPEMKTLNNSHVVWDQEKKLTQLYKVYRLPESFLLDKEHRLVKKISGTIDWHTKDAIEYMNQLIKKSKEAVESQ